MFQIIKNGKFNKNFETLSEAQAYLFVLASVVLIDGLIVASVSTHSLEYKNLLTGEKTSISIKEVK